MDSKLANLHEKNTASKGNHRVAARKPTHKPKTSQRMPIPIGPNDEISWGMSGFGLANNTIAKLILVGEYLLRRYLCEYRFPQGLSIP
jgi:hypothetical protein